MESLETEKTGRKHFLIIGIILTIAAFLRIYQLGHECLWIDEVSSVDQALRPLPELFSGFLRAPFYYFILRCWIKLFGLSEFSLRLPSAIFGILSVYFTYRIGKDFFGRRAGEMGALLLAVSPFCLFFSQEVRHYSLWLLLTLLSNFFFLRIMNREKPGRDYFYYAFVMILSLYTILWSVLMWFVHNLVFFFSRRRDLRPWLKAQLGIFVLYLLWLVPFLLFVSGIKAAVPTWELGWIQPLGWVSLAAFFKTIICRGIYLGASSPDNLRIPFLQAAEIYIFLGLFLLGLLSLDMRRKKNLFLLLWVFFPFGAIIAASLIAFPLFSERYFIFVLPAVFIFIALGISRFKSRAVRISLLGIMLALNLPALLYYYSQDQKPRYDQAVKIIKHHLKNRTELVIDSCREALVFVYYWEKPERASGFSIEIRRRIGYRMLAGGVLYKGKDYDLLIAGNRKQIERFIDNGFLTSLPEVWLVSRSVNGVKQALDAFYGPVSGISAGDITLYDYKNKHFGKAYAETGDK